ncbi:MAG: hypothetical protein M1127_00515 [Patescibacteria group bacterium]|nr:hypothetical protein [Patescibacteria group bacterium]
MVSPQLWLEILSLTKALFDAIKSGADLLASYQKHKQEKETVQESQRVSEVFSTYSENEVKKILLRLEQCRDRFIKQGGGTDRASCLCSILNEVKIGNGGQLPIIDDWANIYRQLGCGTHQ